MMMNSVSADEFFVEEKKASILQDSDGLWDATLNQTDIRNNHNKYYILQLLFLGNNKSKKYWVWTRWGRVGRVAGSKIIYQGTNLEMAKKEFQKRFRSKTKNDWKNRNHFDSVSGSYTLLAKSYTNTTKSISSSLKNQGQDQNQNPIQEITSLSISYPLRNDSNTKQQQKVVELVQFICDQKTMHHSLSAIAYDAKKLPLGNLTLSHLQKAYQVLTEIEDTPDSVKNQKKLEALSNSFYTLIPHVFRLRERPPIIDHTLLPEKIQMMDSLVHMVDGVSCFYADANEKYKNLKCTMEYVDPKKDKLEWNMVERYVNNTQKPGKEHPVTLLQLFRVIKEDKDNVNKLFPEQKNHKLLWHGSRVSNFPGILRQGLRIAPPEAPVSGYLFGKGVYFADMLEKSAAYCGVYEGTGETGLALLCNVALGKPMLHTSTNRYANLLLPGYSSAQAIGEIQPDPDQNMIHPYNRSLIVPQGTGVKTRQDTQMKFNEYIVYDTNQVQMDYLVQLRFD